MDLSLLKLEHMWENIKENVFRKGNSKCIFKTSPLPMT